jgi:hypothetical protein
MPGWTDEEPFKNQFWREVAQHWGVSEDQKGPVLCPEVTPPGKVPCPVCEFVNELKQDKNNARAQELAKELRAKKAYLMNVIDLEDPSYNAKDVAEYTKARPDQDVPFQAGDPKIQVYACPKTIFDQILNCILKNDQDITDLEHGNDLTIERAGKGLTTRYTVSPKLKSTQADIPKDTALPQLDRVGFNMGYDDMVKLLSAGVGGAYASAIPSDTQKTLLGSGEHPSGASGPGSKGSDADDLEAQMASALR